MVVKNSSEEILENVRYEFSINGHGKQKFGAGKVPRIDPGQSVEINSDGPANLEEGPYRIEGCIFSSMGKDSVRPGRIIASKSAGFSVGQ